MNNTPEINEVTMIGKEVAWDAGRRLLMGTVVDVKNNKLTVNVFSSDRKNFRPGLYIVDKNFVTVF